MAQGPAVGNVLGVALLCRDHKALLCLQQRTLREGLRVFGYEAEVHGVQFPMRAPTSPSALRHRRSDAIAVELEADVDTIVDTVRARLEGATIGPLHVRRATVTFDETFGPDERGPALTLEGDTATEAWAWMRIGLRARVQGRHITFRTGSFWWFGRARLDGAAIGLELQRRVLGRVDASIDPVHETLGRALVKAGWKAPRLGRLGLQTAALDTRQLRLVFAEAAQGRVDFGAPMSDVSAAVAADTAAIRLALGQGATDVALRQAVKMAERVQFNPVAEAAAWQWVARIGFRAALRDGDLIPVVDRGLRAWLRAQPNAALPHRMRFELRARVEDYAGIVEDLSRGRDDLPGQLAAAALSLRRLGNADASVEILGRIYGQLDEATTDPGLRADVAGLLARAHATDPAAARVYLHEARRGDASDADLVADVAGRLLEEGHPRVALELLTEALAQHPQHLGLLEAAQAAAREAHDPRTAFELTRARLDAGPGDASAPQLRRALARFAVELGLGDALGYVERAREDDPNDVELLAHAARLHREAGAADEALRAYAALREQLSDPADAARARLEAATLREELAQPSEQIWEELWPALGALPRDEQDRGFALAVETAPADEVEAWVRRLRTRVDLDTSVRALHRRWVRHQVPDAATTTLFEALSHAGATDEAFALSQAAAERSKGRERAYWLTRAAAHAHGGIAASLLDQALRAAPDDEALADRLVALLERAEQTTDVVDLWRGRVEDPALPPRLRLDAIDKLLARAQSDQMDPRLAAREDPELARLYALRLQLDDGDPTTRLVAADQAALRGSDEEAAEHWTRALSLLEPDDRRAALPATKLAARWLAAGDGTRAIEALHRAVRADPEDPAGWQRLAEAAEREGDLEAQLHARESQLAQTTSASVRGDLTLELARLHRLRGDVRQALRWLERARDHVVPDSPREAELAEAWMQLARSSRADQVQELHARRRVRELLGDGLPAAEHRAEALLLAQVERADEGMDVLESALVRTPTDEVLLSTLKELAQHGALSRYASALDDAATSLPPGDMRDALLTERATTALEEQDAAAALEALDQLREETAERAELLDLRDWAVHELGREDDELRRIGDRLRARPDDARTAERLARMLGGDAATLSEHLLGLATGQDAPIASALTLRALASALHAEDDTVLRRAIRRAYDVAPGDLRVRDAWLTAMDGAFAAGDADGVADLLDLRIRRATLDDRAQLDVHLRRALRSFPGSPRLHKVLCVRHGGARTPHAVAAARAMLDGLARELDATSVNAVALYIGFATQLDRADAAALLQDHARAHPDEVDTLHAVADALAERGHVAEQLAVLEMAVEQSRDDTAKVDALKRLAHIAADGLGDQVRAIAHLERAARLAPTDPDLLLPLLEHAFELPELEPILDYAGRVLDHVEMGNAGFLAMIHRTADAALARGDHEAAMDLLTRGHDRDPQHAKTAERLNDLQTQASDPNRRADLLEQVAQRQRGEARLDALEERARLLAGPLDRPREAIRELRDILREDPHRHAANELLSTLLETEAEWHELIELLERGVPRVYGEQRCALLRKIARIARHELRDLQRAEQALRIALEHLGADGEQEHPALAEAMRGELVRDLEGQGRYVDLAIYLERALSTEIDGIAADALRPARTELLVELARIYRGPLDDEAKAARIYERLEHYGRLPDEGLATLARTYQRAGRHEDLVRILKVRFSALADDSMRQAAVSVHVAQLLEAPLGRPHEAAHYYLQAYLASPMAHPEAGVKARVLLSGTDAIANVRAQLLQRLETISDAHRPALHTLLGDLLAVHDEYEDEAEHHYADALAGDANHAAAAEALGRLYARQGRLEDAVEPLVTAATHPELESGRAAETAAIAARVLLELDRPKDAEQVLKTALQRAPESQRALLELARLYERSQRATEQAIVLENLSQLPLSSMLSAEVAYRRATLLMPATQTDPYSAEAERARAYLLEAVSADAKHVSARESLMGLARKRLEWSVVAHMHYLAIRELPGGAARAAHHLDLAETYIEHLDDVDSAVRNIESAITQAPDDLVVSTRAAALTAKLPDPRRIADRLEKIAGHTGSGQLDDAARARLWLLAADLRMSDDDVVAAEADAQQVLDLPEASDDVAAAAQRNLEALEGDEAHELRKQKSGLLRLLEVEEQAVERVHIYGRLRELGLSLGDTELVEWASQEQIELASGLEGTEHDLEAASAALREAYAERGAYEEIVALYEQLAARCAGLSRANALMEAARFAWTAMRDASRALGNLGHALAIAPTNETALELFAELAARDSDDASAQAIYRRLGDVEPADRTPAFELTLAALASDLGRDQDAATLLRPLCVQTEDDDLRFAALQQLDGVLARSGSPTDRVAITRRLFEASAQRRTPELASIAIDLARTEHRLGATDRAAATLLQVLEVDPTHREVLGLYADLVEEAEDWAALGDARRRLASLSSEPGEQAQQYLASAQAFVEQSAATDRSARERSLMQARQALQRAAEVAPQLAAPRVQLLPLAFAESRWDEVLDLAVEVRERAGPDEEVLLLAALTEAFRHGQRSMARDLGFRHGPAAQERYLFPGLRQLLTNVAARGPLPRLDALLAAAGSMLGGRAALARDLAHWSSGRPLQAGLALGLARLAEADGHAERARSLYQITAFMMPDGPVPSLVARLPIAAAPPDLSPLGVGPFEGGGTLRWALMTARDALAGITTAATVAAEPATASAKARLALAESIVAPWRASLGCALPLAWTRARLPGGVGVANHDTPTLLLGAGVTVCSVAELRFRLARAATSVASGLAILEGSHEGSLAALLDGLVRMASPSHVPTGRFAREIAEALSTRGLTLPPREGGQLAEELAHWLTATGGVPRLETELRRGALLFATRLCGQLDGALLALAHDREFVSDGRPDPVATLRDEDAYWLLRALKMY